MKKLSWPQRLWVVEGCEIPENKTSLSTPLCGGGSLRQGPPGVQPQSPLDAFSKQPVRAS